MKKLFESLKSILFNKDLKKMLIKFEFLNQILTDSQLFARNHNVNLKNIDSKYNDNINYQQDIKNFLHKYMILMSMFYNKQKVFAQKHEKNSYY